MPFFIKKKSVYIVFVYRVAATHATPIVKT